MTLEDNIKMVLTEIHFEFGRWLEVLQNGDHFHASVSSVLNWRVWPPRDSHFVVIFACFTKYYGAVVTVLYLSHSYFEPYL
jgi:hypothetical protein